MMTPWPNFHNDNKGPALTEALAAAGIRIEAVDNVVYVSDLVAARAIAQTVDPLAYERAAKKAAVRARAAELTEARLPARRVFKGLAAALTILRKAPASRTAGENSRLDAIVTALDSAGRVETAADAIEAEIDAMTDWQAVRAFNAETSSRWAE